MKINPVTIQLINQNVHVDISLNRRIKISIKPDFTRLVIVKNNASITIKNDEIFNPLTSSSNLYMH